MIYENIHGWICSVIKADTQKSVELVSEKAPGSRVEILKIEETKNIAI